MTPLTQLAPHTTTAGRPRAARATHASAREARTRRSFDAVLASYIRELSAAGDTTPRPRAGRTVKPLGEFDDQALGSADKRLA